MASLTLLPFLVRALVVALRDFPQINATYDDKAQIITRHGAVHVGIATQGDNGLMVPVLRHAEAGSLWTNAGEISRLANAARNNKASREELSGSTITLTSLGALGGIVSTPVVNTPEVAIVGVNRMVERPVVIDGQIVVRKMMNLSSSFDHRVVDGMDAALFIQAVRGLLEQPACLFVGEHATDYPNNPLLIIGGGPGLWLPSAPGNWAFYRAGGRPGAGRYLPEHRLHSIQGADPCGRAVPQASRFTEPSPLGISVASPRLDIGQSVAWKDGIVDRLTTGVAALLKSTG